MPNYEVQIRLNIQTILILFASNQHHPIALQSIGHMTRMQIADC